jgi:hypothetical protein
MPAPAENQLMLEQATLLPVRPVCVFWERTSHPELSEYRVKIGWPNGNSETRLMQWGELREMLASMKRR